MLRGKEKTFSICARLCWHASHCRHVDPVVFHNHPRKLEMCIGGTKIIFFLFNSQNDSSSSGMNEIVGVLF